MIIIPAIDLKDKKCVQLVGGVFGSEQVVIEDVAAVAEQFYAAGIKRLHIIDLDAAKSIGDNMPIIKNLLASKQCEAEVGGGIRTFQKAEEIIAAGADYIIVGTAAVKNKQFLKGLITRIGKQRIIISLDYKNRKVLTHGWDAATEKSPLEFGKELQNLCGAFLMTCVDKEGQLKGSDAEYLTEIVREIRVPIIASGGINSLDDLKNLKKIGVFGAVIGMAIYKGNINLKEAIAL